MTDYISLADAWARFCEAEGVASVIDAMRSRPTAVIVRDMLDPDDFPPEPKQIHGPGIVDQNRLAYFAGKFRDKIVWQLKDATFLLSYDGSHESVAPAEWWKTIKPQLFACDTAEGLRIGTAFPLAIYFDRAQFNRQLEATGGATDLEALALKIYESGEHDGVKAWKVARENYGIICTRAAWLDAWKSTPNSGRQGPKGPRKNYPKGFDGAE